MSQKKTLSVQLVSQIKAFSSECETLLGPLLVFLVCYCHHLYFAHQLISSIFIGSGLVSLICVHAFGKNGLIAAGFVQLAFLIGTAFETSGMLLEQITFCTSLSVALVASYTNQMPVEEKSDKKELEELSTQKQQLWQQLFDARQEITTLYQHKLEKEQLQVELAATESKILLFEHQLEASVLYKQELVQEKMASEEEIARLLSHMREMAERPSEEIPMDAKHRQLREQFEAKSQVLDQTRKDLFFAQEEVEILKRSFFELQAKSPSEEEKFLQNSLAEASRELEKLSKAHSEELQEYETIIHDLFQQISELQAK